MRLNILDHLSAAERGNKHQPLQRALALRLVVLNTIRLIKLKKLKMRSKYQVQLPRIWWKMNWYLLDLTRAASISFQINTIKWVQIVIWAQKKTSVRIRLRKCRSKWWRSRIKVKSKWKILSNPNNRTRKMIVKKALKNVNRYSLQNLLKLRSSLEAARRSQSYLSEI